MDTSPAIALIEFRSVAAGTFATDRMVKASPVKLLRAGTIHPGKYLVLVGGGPGEVEVAHDEGLRTAESELVDEVLLADVAREVSESIQGRRRVQQGDSMCVLETSTVAAIVRASDAAVKGAEVTLQEIRLGDGLGGKGVAHLTGERRDVEAAVEIAERVLDGRDVQLCRAILSRVDDALAARLDRGTLFRSAE